ncbi:MAG: YbeD family protein [Lysobacteraceae bacterium]
MDIHSDNPDHGFQFPGDFELSAMGAAEAQLHQRIPQVMAELGLVVDPDATRSRPSSKGTYVSVTVRFRARSREELDAAHEALRALPGVKWTL